jgi:hypothetical protein
MSEVRSTSGGGGFGVVSVLTIVFVVLKLTGTITWSWWWVLSPLWISFGLGIVLLIVFGVIALIVGAIASGSSVKQRNTILRNNRSSWKK